MNPLQIISMIKNGGNPQQVLMGMLDKSNNPVLNNLINLAKEGKTKEIEDIARNIVTEQGKDFDQEFNSFRQNLGI